jgi:hypothetical protein
MVKKIPAFLADFRYWTDKIKNGLNLSSGIKSKMLKLSKTTTGGFMMTKGIYLKTATLFVFLGILSIPSYAQPGRGQGGRRQFTEEDVRRRIGNMADSLDMTDDQHKKILEFELENFKESQEMRENFDPETGDREAMREFMMKQREERNAKYEELLTEEQYAKYQEMADRRRQNMRRRMEDDPGGRGRGRGRG